MLVFFHSLGFVVEKSDHFIIPIDISSSPWVFFGSNDLIMLTISSVQNSKVDSFCSVEKVLFGWIELSLSTVVYF